MCTREQGGVFRLVGHNRFVQSSSNPYNSLFVSEGTQCLELALCHAIMKAFLCIFDLEQFCLQEFLGG